MKMVAKYGVVETIFMSGYYCEKNAKNGPGHQLFFQKFGLQLFKQTLKIWSLGDDFYKWVLL